MKTKVCTKCGLDKPFSNFYKHKGGKYGLRAQCISCRNSVAKLWEKSNPEVVKQNRAKCDRSPNTKKYRKKYREMNRPYFRAKCANYSHKKKSASPSWLSEDHLREILAFYEHAADCAAVSGQEYHVDHIIPLNGENISGLHVPWNLQVLPADVNISKGNSYDPDSATTKRTAC